MSNQKIWVVPAIWAAISAALLLWYFATSHGGYDFTDHIIGRDFINTHLGGTLINSGQQAVLFDGAAYHDEIKRFHGEGYPIHNWSYPPLLWPVSQGLGVLPYFVAYALWTCAGIAMVALTVRVLELPMYWAALIVLSPAGFWNLFAGQNGFFISSVLVLAVVMTYRNAAVRAGLGWAFLAIKPHLGLCVLPLLIGKLRIAVMLWGGLFLGVAIAGTIWAYGLSSWQMFLEITSKQQLHVVETWENLLLAMIPSAFMQGRLWGWETGNAYLLHFAFAAVSAIFLVLRWPRAHEGILSWVMWLVLGTMLLLPYSFNYDGIMLYFALALWGVSSGFQAIPRTTSNRVFALIWSLPWISFFLAQNLAIQITPIVLLALLIWSPWRADKAQ